MTSQNGPSGPIEPGSPIYRSSYSAPRSSRRRIALPIGIAAAVLVAGGAFAAMKLTGNDTAGGDPTTTPPPPIATGSPSSGAAGGAGAGVPSGNSFSMTATGDIIMGNAPNALPPNSGAGFFDPVKDSLQADFQMGNLEQTLTEATGVGKCSAASAGRTCFAFRTPPSFAQVLKDTGFDLMNMANNHAYDFGEAGYKNTQAALDGAGIKYTGAPNLITVVPVNGVRVAVVGFASYAWSNDVTKPDEAAALVARAAQQADVVVVQVHMGAEGGDKTHVKPGSEIFLGENRGDPIRFSHAVIDAGADLVIGHGPHVMRGMEFYRDRLIAYSLGNFAGYRSLGYSGVTGVGGVLKVTLRGDGSYVSGSLAPTVMVSPGVPRPDPKRQAISLVGGLSKTDFPNTGAAIADSGEITPKA